MSLRYWQQIVKADPTAYADFLEWAEEERQRLVEMGFHAASWEALLVDRGAKKTLDLLVASFKLPDLEESQRAGYRRRNT